MNLCLSAEEHLDELLTIFEFTDYISMLRLCKTHRTIWDNLSENHTIKKLLQQKRIERNRNEVQRYLQENKSIKSTFRSVISDEKAYLIIDFFKQGVNIKSCINELLLLVCKIGHREALDHLLSQKTDIKHFEQQIALAHACDNNHLALVQRLLVDDRFDPAAFGNIALEVACTKGYIDIVNILFQDKRVDAQLTLNYSSPGGLREFNALQNAIHNGHLNVVHRLLADPRFEPHYKDNIYIRVACQEGHLDIVNRLLKEPLVDPSANSNHASQLACGRGHLDIIRRLLVYKSVTVLDNIHSLIIIACEKDHRAIFELLLTTISLCNGDIEYLIEKAVKQNSIDIFQYLVDHDLLSKSNKLEYYIHLACEQDHLEIF